MFNLSRQVPAQQSVQRTGNPSSVPAEYPSYLTPSARSLANPASDSRFASTREPIAAGATFNTINSTSTFSTTPTRFRWETRTRKIPIANRETGEVTYRDETYTVQVPVFEQALSQEDQEVMKLSALLKAVDSGQVKMSNEDADANRKELAELVSGQFDKRHEEQLEKVAEIEKKASDLRKTLEKRLAAKSEIVERRIRDLLGEPDPMAWDHTVTTYPRPDSPRSAVSPILPGAAPYPNRYPDNTYGTTDSNFAPSYRVDQYGLRARLDASNATRTDSSSQLRSAPRPSTTDESTDSTPQEQPKTGTEP